MCLVDAAARMARLNSTIIVHHDKELFVRSLVLRRKEDFYNIYL
jgi:hypothetical protein